MGVAEFTVFLTGEGTRRDKSSRVRGAFALLAWQIFLSVDFSQPLGKSIVSTASFTIIFLLILIHAQEDAKFTVGQKDFDSGVCQR